MDAVDWAVVMTSVIAVEPESAASDDGVMVYVAPAGRPVTERLMAAGITRGYRPRRQRERRRLSRIHGLRGPAGRNRLSGD